MDVAIAGLKAERERLAQQKKRVRKDLKNAQKQRSRVAVTAASFWRSEPAAVLRGLT